MGCSGCLAPCDPKTQTFRKMKLYETEVFQFKLHFQFWFQFYTDVLGFLGIFEFFLTLVMK